MGATHVDQQGNLVADTEKGYQGQMKSSKMEIELDLMRQKHIDTEVDKAIKRFTLTNPMQAYDNVVLEQIAQQAELKAAAAFDAAQGHRSQIRAPGTPGREAGPGGQQPLPQQGVPGAQQIPNYDPSQPAQWGAGTHDPSQQPQFQQLQQATSIIQTLKPKPYQQWTTQDKAMYLQAVQIMQGMPGQGA